MRDVLILGSADIERILSRAAAAQVITQTIQAGFEPGDDPQRSIVDVSNGQLLLMPSQSASSVGVKAVTIAPDNPAIGLSRIQAVYLLFDAETLRLRAILDGTTLTNLRTPAVSIAATAPALRRFARPVNVVGFGAGPQAIGHVAALAGCQQVALGRVTFVVRHFERVREELPQGAVVLGCDDPTVNDVLETADVLVCASTARTPLFDSRHLAKGSVVIAVGSHEPAARELDGRLMGTADVIVEDVDTALREAGEVIMAIEEGQLQADDLIPMADVIRGDHMIDPGRTVVFKSTGMSWEDLVLAEAIAGRRLDSVPDPAR